MNYFELFDIPVSLTVDASSIKKKFYALSRQFHPDFFSNTSEEEQAKALEMSALLNKALQVFSNSEETIKYVLQLKGLLEEEEKYQLPPDFLMEVMDLNELLMEVKMEGEVASDALKQQIANLETDLYEPVKNIMADYQEGITSEKELLQVKKYYFQKKYIARMLSTMAG